MKLSSNIISTVLAAFMVLSCSQDMEKDNPLNVDSTKENVIDHQSAIPSAKKGKAIVEFTDEMVELIGKDLANGSVTTRSAGLNHVVDQIGIKAMKPLFPDAGKFEARHREAGLHRYYEVEFEENVPVTKALADFSELEGVSSVEPVLKIKLCGTPVFNDPFLQNQWHYYNDGTRSERHIQGADINIVPVWEYFTTGSSDVIVGVVDGGIQYDHPDLAANYYMGANFAHSSVVVPHDHGTHVAGTIAAINNNGTGVCGIAGGNYAENQPGVKLLSAQIFEPNPNDPENDYSGSGSSAIVWSCDQGAVISQNSWGFDFQSEQQAASYTIPGHLKSAIDYFIKNAGYDENGKQVGPMAGGVVIFAAGNQGWSTDPIGRYNPVISVGSMAPDFGRAYYSNYGDWVDIAAPGGDAYFTGGGVWSTVTNSRYAAYQGTSMACPHVSGVAALLVSYYGGHGFTNEMLKEKLFGGARYDAIDESIKIGPLLDAYGSFLYGRSAAPEAVRNIKVFPDVHSIKLKFKVTTDDVGVKAYGYTAFVSENKSSIEAIDDFLSDPSDVLTYEISTKTVKAGEEISIDLTDLKTTTEYHIAVVGYDGHQNFSELSEIITTSTTINYPPEIKLDKESVEVHAHETVKIKMEITDPNGHEFTTAFTSGSKALNIEKISDSIYEITIKGSAAKEGEYTAKFTATDIYNEYTVKTLKYTILKNHAPEYMGEMPDIIIHDLGESVTMDLSQYFNDPDGENLSFKVDQTEYKLNARSLGFSLTLTSLSYGLTTVSITATDYLKEKCSGSFKVFIRSEDTEIVSSYPNPVKDVLFVRTSDESQETRIVLKNATGKTVYDTTVITSVFNPAEIDMTGYAAGRYVLNVSCKEGTVSKNIVKL